MSKIFRLHTGGTETIEHWQETGTHLHDTFIASINDPAGDTAQTQITSIPSPFARMDLVKTAFKTIWLKKDLDGTTVHHRIVSDCLDVTGLFFNIEALSDKIEVLEWNSGIIVNGGEPDIDPGSDLGRLLHGVNPKHRLLGETLQMFLVQDRHSFNFLDLKHCYLLNYKYGPELVNIIGGTSPVTMFFSSANDLSYVDISFGNDHMFDEKFSPLHKRSKEFIKFFYEFRAAYNAKNPGAGFSVKFPDLNNYLELTFEQLDNTTKEMIRGIVVANKYEEDYNKISVNSAGNHAEILGFTLRARNYGGPVQYENDFIVEASRPMNSGQLPCVLPNEPFNEPLKYAGAIWQKNFYEKVPFYDARPIQERTLPNQEHVKYPFLTVSDLLEPYLIKLPFPSDNDRFFTGNYDIKSGEADHCFALPIKKEYFNYFSLEDLQGVVSDGKKRFELVQLPAGVKAILRIPIKNNNYIQLARDYSINQFQDKLQPADEKSNIGIITDNQFTMAIYPFVRFNPDVNPHYRVLLVDRDVAALTKKNNYLLRFYDETKPQHALDVPRPKIRSNKQYVQGVSSIYHIVEHGFDFIEVTNNTCTGLLVPLMQPQPIAAKRFKFAVDFGTTNTHIEYKAGNEDARPFDITEQDIQIGTLHAPTEATEVFLKKPSLVFGASKLVEIIKEEFIPAIIQKSTQYKFPQRTVINDNGVFNPDEPTFALADFNIPFWYLKEDYRLNSEITSNLKWVDFKHNKRFERRTRAFLKQLMLMMRNKVVMNGGDLAATEIVWFYPSSMPRFRRNFLQASWDKYYERYFPGAHKLNSMSESFAPFYYYYTKESVKPFDRPAVNIDIGGGTTDVVIYQGGDPVVLTSFRFAANSVFGDGYGNTAASNGFVQHYEEIVMESLANSPAQNLNQIYTNLKEKNSGSVELIEFFFSLEDNKVIKDNRIPISFSKLLAADEEMKLVFVFFYAAIVYHIARLMKVKNMPVPEYITFSGNGSRIIKLTEGSAKLSTLLSFTRVIFEAVYEAEKVPLIEFRFFANPKEITCKGGLECNDFEKFEALEQQITTVLIGTNDTDTIAEKALPYSKLENSDVINSVCDEVTAFINKFFDWNSRFNYYKNFGISPQNFTAYKEVLCSKIKSDLISGIREKLNEIQGNADINIEESLFFYPLAGAINRLAFKIHQQHQ